MYLMPAPFRPDTFSQYGYADARGRRALDRGYGHDAYPQYPTAIETPRVLQGLAGLGALPTKSQQETMRKSARRPVLTKVRATPSKDGKTVTVPVSSFWAGWNTQVANTLTPFRGVIDALPLSTSDKNKLKTRPLDAMLDMLDPVEDVVGRAIDTVIAQKGSRQNYFGTTRDVRRVQAIDLRADTSTRNLLKRLRTIDAFIVLMWTQPVELAAAMAKQGVNIATDVAQTVATNVSQTAQHVATAVQSFFGVRGLGALGEPATLTAAGAITTLAASFGVVLDVALVESVLVIVGMIVTALGTLATTAALLTPAEKESSGAAGAVASPSNIVITPAALANRQPVTQQPTSPYLVPFAVAALVGVAVAVTR